MLAGLRDLDQSQPYIQQKIAAAMNYLIGLGIAGFRIDAMKHMWPQDVEKIWDMLNPLDEKIYGVNASAFMFHEVSYSPGEVRYFFMIKIII